MPKDLPALPEAHRHVHLRASIERCERYLQKARNAVAALRNPKVREALRAAGTEDTPAYLDRIADQEATNAADNTYRYRNLLRRRLKAEGRGD